MFKIKHTANEENNQYYLDIYGLNGSCYAKICLNQGASLQELIIDNHHVIKDMHPLTYDNTYASSILFPFANRIKDGSYQFNKETFQFDINERDLKNALHGLVYNKTFDVINEEATDKYASVRLGYHEKKMSNGFPYTYSIYLEYVLAENALDLNVEIKNTYNKTFPFTLGWHPYFLSSDLYSSSLIFDSTKKAKLDSRNIPQEIVNHEYTNTFKITEQSLDDCYVLDSNTVHFLTPKYVLTLKSTEEECFLQLYTPPHKNTIALEPTTGISDSFNNGIGLKILQPDETYNLSWNLKIKDN